MLEKLAVAGTLVESGGLGPPGPEELARLKEMIKARFGSIYAFSKRRAVGMARGTLYQVLSGRYGGNIERQAAKIRAALGAEGAFNSTGHPATAGSSGADTSPVGMGSRAAGPGAYDTLRLVACGRCRRKRPKARQCGQCEELWRAQAEALREGWENDQTEPD